MTLTGLYHHRRQDWPKSRADTPATIRLRADGYWPPRLLSNPGEEFWIYARTALADLRVCLCKIPGSPIEVKTQYDPDCLPLQGGALARPLAVCVRYQEVAAMSDPRRALNMFQQVLLGDIVKNGETAIALVESVILRSLYSN